jgi:hypothetical protein
MARCSASGGMRSRKLGMSAHFRLSKTAPTLRNLPICSHHSGPRTSHRRNGGCTTVPSDRRRTRFWPRAKSRRSGTNAVTPGFVRRDKTTSSGAGAALRVHSMKCAGVMRRALVTSIRPSLSCGIVTYG